MGKPRVRPQLLKAQKRLELFRAAYTETKGNGVAAARAAGYKGTPASLAVTASRLLRKANADQRVEQALEKVVSTAAVGAQETVDRLSRLARLMDVAEGERPDVFDFITFLGDDPRATMEPATADSIEDAKAKVREQKFNEHAPPPGFAIDLPKAQRLGLGKMVKEIGHDAETGAPKIKLGGDRVALLQISLKALDSLAKIHRLYLDEPPPPPKPDLAAREIMRLMPLEALRAWDDAVAAARAKARAIETTAKRLGG